MNGKVVQVVTVDNEIIFLLLVENASSHLGICQQHRL